MIGSIQMICGMGVVFGILRLLFGGWGAGWKGWLNNALDSLGLIICCGAAWWFLACFVGSETPE